jgi:hypothetical protein
MKVAILVTRHTQVVMIEGFINEPFFKNCRTLGLYFLCHYYLFIAIIAITASQTLTLVVVAVGEAVMVNHC